MPLHEVTLDEMLAAREQRAARQTALCREGTTLVSFSLNIAGPVKDSPLLRRAYAEGRGMLLRALHGEHIPLLLRDERTQATGCEGLFLLDEADPLRVKRITAAIEDACPFGRLLDLDVLDGAGRHLSRADIGRDERACLVCGAPGRTCASRRLHSVDELRRATQQLLESHFLSRDLDEIVSAAVRALLWEVCTTPKPGLVDRENNGSHRDMTLFHFLDSTAALMPYLRRCAQVGVETRALPAPHTFASLRAAGRCAEYDMLRATGGVNTHKGAIFTMGLLCAAQGRLRSAAGGLCRTAQRTLDEVAAMTRDAPQSDLPGARKQAAAGLPAVRDVALPRLEQALRAGESLERAGAVALAHLIASVDDTNMVRRGGPDLARYTAGELRLLLAADPLPDNDRLRRLNDSFTAQNLSPGGCADLLAAAYFLRFLADAPQDGAL